MSFSIYSIPIFDKQVKRLSKKYPSIKKDLAKLINILIEEPEHGTPLGNNFFKIRIAISSKGKGKSAGARVITYLKIADQEVYLTYIFDKSAKSTITDIELSEIFKLLP